MRRLSSAAGLLAACLVLAACSQPVAVDPADATSASGPQVVPVQVACTPEGVSLSAANAVATSAGVVLVLRSSAPAGTYLLLRFDAGSISQPIPTEPQRTVLALPPGEVRASCVLPGAASGGPVGRLAITDPDRHWQAGSAEGLGCEDAGTATARVARTPGATPRAAAEALLPELEGVAWPLSTEPAPLGYPDASSQTWWVVRGTTPVATLRVYRQGTGWWAAPERLCRTG